MTLPDALVPSFVSSASFVDLVLVTPMDASFVLFVFIIIRRFCRRKRDADRNGVVEDDAVGNGGGGGGGEGDGNGISVSSGRSRSGRRDWCGDVLLPLQVLPVEVPVVFVVVVVALVDTLGGCCNGDDVTSERCNADATSVVTICLDDEWESVGSKIDTNDSFSCGCCCECSGDDILLFIVVSTTGS